MQVFCLPFLLYVVSHGHVPLTKLYPGLTLAKFRPELKAQKKIPFRRAGIFFIPSNLACKTLPYNVKGT